MYSLKIKESVELSGQKRYIVYRENVQNEKQLLTGILKLQLPKF